MQSIRIAKPLAKVSYGNLKVTLALLFVASLPLQLHSMPQASRDFSGQALTAKESRQLEKTASTASDHKRLAAYYQFQARQAEKNLADAEELRRKWRPMERATKAPDPYPHARRLIGEYSAQVQKYCRRAADHLWIATKYEIAERSLKTGGNAGESSTSQGNVTPLSPKQ